MKLSIIIANHNYRDFVGVAIASALAVDWPDKEVIVVDDDSTDDSRSIIEDFSGRVAAYFRPKSHQLGAHMFGFEQSTGEVIIFLDADDLLEPEVMQEVAKLWRPGISKVQYRMNVIDATGRQLGTAIPQFPAHDDPAKLRRNFLRTMAYTTPPGSGNAYSRDFVRNVFSLGSRIPQSDAALLTVAPILGDVVTIRRPLARYRVHDVSYSAMGPCNVGNKLRQSLYQDIEKARLFASVTQRLNLRVPRDPLKDSLHHLQYRIASYLVEPSAHPFPEDTKSSLLFRLVSSAVFSSQMPARDRALLIAWALACTLSPPGYRQFLIQMRFSVTSRPMVVRALLGKIGSLASGRLPDRT
jgi:glycosyltransferase involved in cell wall biosynthesis